MSHRSFAASFTHGRPRGRRSRVEIALFLAVTGVACFAGSVVGARWFAPRSACAEPAPTSAAARPAARRTEGPLVVAVPTEGELFLGAGRNILMTVREEGSGGVLELYDPSGARIVVNDLDTRLRGAEARVKLLEQAEEDRKRAAAARAPKVDTGNPFVDWK